MKKFLPILLGSDLNTYSIAREIHEAYGIRSAVATSRVLLPCANSKLFYTIKKPSFSKDTNVFAELLNEIYHNNEDRYQEFIIFAPDDNFRNMTIDNLNRLDFKPLLPYPSKDIIDGLLNKSDFYDKIESLGLAPKTLIATPDNYKNLDYPEDVYIKADHDILYKKKLFDGWQKGYHSKSLDQTIEILEKIFAGGYDEGMIVQEFIQGGDGTEYSVDGYRSKSTISMSACKNVLLDKRPEWIGNFAAKIDTDEDVIYQYAKDIVETLGVYRLFNIDFKKDLKTGKFYAFEINLRQGRCHYYASQNGVNTSKIAIEDLVYNNEQEIIGDKKFAYYNLTLDETLENMPANLKEEFTDPERMKNLANPLIYEKDWSYFRKRKINPYLERLSEETFKYSEI